MAFITISNAKKLVRKLDQDILNGSTGDLYQKPIYFFSKRETANLHGIRELFENMEQFVVEYYQPIVTKDSYRYVFPESQPAYHKDNTCERLNSSFHNIEVPLPIFEKGEAEVLKFRDWYSKTKFEEGNLSDYIKKLQLAFIYVGEIHPSSIEYNNSGPELKKDYTLSELESEIDELLRKADDYFSDNPAIRNIISRFQKLTFLGFVPGVLKDNQSGLNDQDLKDFLRSYERAFKTPVKERLVEYYRVKFNPDMKFEGTLLVQLGFRPCSHCLGKSLK